jgi:hypothetical protein
LPVVASAACTAPVQSSKYAMPSTTTGVPVTPTMPSIDHCLRRRTTVDALMLRSNGLRREFA